MARRPDTVPTSASETAPSFEEALAELENIVAAMEAGKMPLQESLDAYRRGMALLGQCRARLDAAEQQIRILEDGELRDFAPQASGIGTANENED